MVVPAGPDAPTKGHAMHQATTDLSDAHDVSVIGLGRLRHYGGRRRFAGTVVTVTAPGDNTSLRGYLEEADAGTVVVVDGRRDPQCALLGDRLAGLGVERGVAGLVVLGNIRDAEAVAQLPIGVLAHGTHPRRSAKRGDGGIGADIAYDGVVIRHGQWLCADHDGLVIADTDLSG